MTEKVTLITAKIFLEKRVSFSVCLPEIVFFKYVVECRKSVCYYSNETRMFRIKFNGIAPFSGNTVRATDFAKNIDKYNMSMLKYSCKENILFFDRLVGDISPVRLTPKI